MARWGLVGIFVLLTTPAFARVSGQIDKDRSRITYDVSGSSGTYNSSPYTEFTLGLNWIFDDWLTWRNSAFTRNSSASTESYSGLDSSLRLSTEFGEPQDTFGVNAFIGPGVRLASKDNNAAFAEAGITFRIGGLRLGVGGKALAYFANRDDGTGTNTSLPKNDTQFFVTISGGGTL